MPGREAAVSRDYSTAYQGLKIGVARILIFKDNSTTGWKGLKMGVEFETKEKRARWPSLS